MTLPLPSTLDRSYAAKPMFEQHWKATAPDGRSIILARSESLTRQMGYSGPLSGFLGVEMDKRTMLWTVKVVCIGRGALSSTDTNIVPIFSSPAEGSVTPSPAWPFSDSCCYIFPRSMKFLCYPVKYSLSLLPGCSAQPTSISSD
jgi:hypothetical protein